LFEKFLRYAPPSRPADFTVREKTAKNQALIYRIPSGDANPLHADPDMAAIGGLLFPQCFFFFLFCFSKNQKHGPRFEKPILHGLCTFGYAGRAVIASCCNNDSKRFKSISVRFAGHVFPGETIETSIWRVSDTQVIFETKVVERGTVAISNAMVELFGSSKL
jgi:acyl dehydratase